MHVVDIRVGIEIRTKVKAASKACLALLVRESPMNVFIVEDSSQTRKELVDLLTSAKGRSGRFGA
jgi:hypothetical protein